MNQAMRFGKLPHWASELAAKLPVHLFGHEVAFPVSLLLQLNLNLRSGISLQHAK